MHEPPEDREELLEHLLRDHKVTPEKDLTGADASTLAARHERAHQDPYEAHEPHT